MDALIAQAFVMLGAAFLAVVLVAVPAPRDVLVLLKQLPVLHARLLVLPLVLKYVVVTVLLYVQVHRSQLLALHVQIIVIVCAQLPVQQGVQELLKRPLVLRVQTIVAILAKLLVLRGVLGRRKLLLALHVRTIAVVDVPRSVVRGALIIVQVLVLRGVKADVRHNVNITVRQHVSLIVMEVVMILVVERVHI